MNILFVCTGNTCRSPMAEGILRDLAREKGLDIRVKSAGIFALDGGDIAGNAVEVLRDIDIDISNNKSSSISEELVKEANIVLAMSNTHRESLLLKFPFMKNKIFLLNEFAFGKNKDIEDPFGGSKEYYERARDEIYKAIVEIIDNGKWNKL